MGKTKHEDILMYNGFGIILLHIKKDLFSFSIHVFRPVESKSNVHFRRPEPENLDNPEKQGIFRIIEEFRIKLRKNKLLRINY